ncbi:MAG: hypothetical protein ACK4OP_13800, partial [Gemmobacter sp.]
MARQAADITIRPYEGRDREGVRAINLRTAWRNRGYAAMLNDPVAHADYWTLYFTDHRPEASWVVERDGTMIGYFLGCTDQAHFLRVMKTRIVPRVAARAIWKSLTRQYDAKSRAYVRHMILKGPGETPDFPFLDYPAHYHCNILRAG